MEKLIEVVYNGQTMQLTPEQYAEFVKDPKKKIVEHNGELRVLEKMNG